MQKAMAVAGSVCVPLPFVPPDWGGGSWEVPPSTALLAAQILSLFSELAAKLWLFKVKLVAVKANGCLLYRQVFLKDQNIQEFICEFFGAFVCVVFFFFNHDG